MNGKIVAGDGGITGGIIIGAVGGTAINGVGGIVIGSGVHDQEGWDDLGRRCRCHQYKGR